METRISKDADSIVQNHMNKLVGRYPQLAICQAAVKQSAEVLIRSFASGAKLLIAGNGGSAADSDHIVGELMKNFMRKRPLPDSLVKILSQQTPEYAEFYQAHLQQGLPSIALTNHSALSSAYANDEDPSLVYSQQLLGYAKPGDIFWGISTSGNSLSICHALRLAKALGLTSIGLTGKHGGRFNELADIVICVPESVTAYVQELHLPVYHAICLAVEAVFFPELE